VSFELYHQLGHNYSWNLQSIKHDSAGQGVILGPKNIEKTKVEKLPVVLRTGAIFDPQFFAPATPKGELDSYEFFPNVVADGFETESYDENQAGECAERCVGFQLANGFRYTVVPAKHMAGTPSNFIETQERVFINPFLSAIRAQKRTNGILLQVLLNDTMLKDRHFHADLLNWITGFEGIQGVYLIVETSGSYKQIKDAELLYQYLGFINALRQNELEVVLGYLNTEALLLSLADPTIVATGSYENTRAFRIGSFRESKPQHGPSPRLYVSSCLQWVDYNYVYAIIRLTPNGRTMFDQNKYQAIMFEPTFKWHFMKSELYKHYFFEFARQLKTVSSVTGKERYILVRKMLQDAMTNFRAMDDSGVALDPNSDGSHLPHWLTAANGFAKDQGWV
jgi:hypothetical protein